MLELVYKIIMSCAELAINLCKLECIGILLALACRLEHILEVSDEVDPADPMVVYLEILLEAICYDWPLIAKSPDVLKKNLSAAPLDVLAEHKVCLSI